MRTIIATALALLAAPAAADPVDYVSVISGYIVAEDYCGLTVPQYIKTDALERALVTKDPNRLREEVIAITRIIIMQFEDTTVAVDFCVEMGRHFK